MAFGSFDTQFLFPGIATENTGRSMNGSTGYQLRVKWGSWLVFTRPLLILQKKLKS